MHRLIKDVYICCFKKEYKLKTFETICRPDPRDVRQNELGIYLQGCSEPSYWDYGIVFSKNKDPVAVTA